MSGALDAAVEKAAEALWLATGRMTGGDTAWRHAEPLARAYCLAMARAVIEALGLTEETRDDSTDWTKHSSQITYEHRLVTPWETT